LTRDLFGTQRSVMKQENSHFSSENIEEALWQEKRKRISAVWIVPIVALIVGAWLIVSNINAKGPVIQITFQSAEGVKAGKTVIKYKDIEVGKVTNVAFNKDLSSVIVTAEMTKNMKPYLSEKSKFWIMKARVGLNQVEGLDTLLSGVYIVMDPEKGLQEKKEFEGLDTIPVISTDEKGTRYFLKAQDIGSIDLGSPIYYKRLNAGRVISYHLSKDSRSVEIEIFIKAPFDKLIYNNTRFWNASGITANIGADGVELHTESLTALLTGGLAFDNLITQQKEEKASKGHYFTLYQTQKEAKALHYNRELYFWVYFQSSVRGLSEGAPVEFRGVKIGEVVSFSLIGNADAAKFEIPILIKIEPERFMILPHKNKNSKKGVNESVLQKLIEKGFRAQLKSGNLITGELYIDLDMYQNVPSATLVKKEGLYVLPAVPGTIESLKSDIQTLLDRLASVPFEEIGKELQMSIKDLRTSTIPKIDATIQSTDSMMKNAGTTIKVLQKNYLDSNAEINKKIIKLIEEMTKTSRSVKNLSDYLERHPDSLLKGK